LTDSEEDGVCNFWEACYVDTTSTTVSTTTTTTTTTSSVTTTTSTDTKSLEEDDTCNFWEDCTVEEAAVEPEEEPEEVVVVIDKVEEARITSIAVTKREYTFQGVFSYYEFAGTDEAFNWVFIDPAGNVYQLHGNEPTSRDVFGWKSATLAEDPTPNWYMFALGYDVDGDGSEQFDWVIVSADPNNKQAYKLAGATENDTVLYSEKLSVDYTLSADRKSITFK